ncbi:MAG TPA: hypothetical protein PK109_02310 [Candidatus Paceibacterota bacterium]|nr:hypothetical protein [Candidatus Paceibacterota bacterium]
MDIEDLSKSQLLLLTILVNFVVSIATGVLTVSLLDEAPTTVTQTVNRIVDHTIETVTTQVPTIGKDSTPSSEELLTAAIAENAEHMVTISYRVGAESTVVNGLYLPSTRLVMTASSNMPGHITVTFPNGAAVEADRTASDGTLMRYGFAADAVLPQASTLTLVPASSLKQGQTIIGLSADGKAVTGIIGKVDTDGIHAELPAVSPGAPIVNLSGAVIGIAAGGNLFYTADRISTLQAAP